MKPMLLIVCILGINSVYSETCPSYEEIAPCTCHELPKADGIEVDCLANSPIETEELANIMMNFNGKKNVELYLTGFDLTKVPMKLFQGIGIIQLHFSSCNLANVSDDQVALLGLEDTLEVLSIMQSINKGNDISGLKLGHLRKLKHLGFFRNVMPDVHNSLIENSSVEELRFNHNMIENLGDRAFASLSNLIKLELGGNNFGQLKRNMLPAVANRLTTLDISSNSFTSLDEDLFSKMPALQDVTLFENKISTLEQNTWKFVWEQLMFVGLQGNPIQCDSGLEWAFDLRRPSLIYGTCEEPASVKGKFIEDFIDKRGQ